MKETRRCRYTRIHAYHACHTPSRHVLNARAIAVAVGSVLVIRPVLDHAEPLLPRQLHIVAGHVIGEGVTTPERTKNYTYYYYDSHFSPIVFRSVGTKQKKIPRSEDRKMLKKNRYYMKTRNKIEKILLDRQIPYRPLMGNTGVGGVGG